MKGPQEDRGGLGPTDGQSRSLKHFGANTDDYKNMSPGEIGSAIRSLAFKANARNLGLNWIAERKERIEELGLKPGMRIRWLTSEGRLREDVISKITTDLYVICVGLKTRIRPSIIKGVVKGDQ